MSDTDLDLLDTDISSKNTDTYISKTSLRHLQDMSSRRPQDISSGLLEDVFSVRNFRLPKNCYSEEVLKTPPRHILRTSSRRLEDQQIFPGS